MSETLRQAKVVLILFTGFALFCCSWFFSRATLPQPYQVSTAQRPAEIETASSQEEASETGSWPESLLSGEKININTADSYDLQRLPGVGEKRAQDIILYREEHGPFQTVEELTNVSGIGPGILEGLREYAAIENE